MSTEKRLVLALALSVGVLLLWSTFIAPPSRKPPAEVAPPSVPPPGPQREAADPTPPESLPASPARQAPREPSAPPGEVLQAAAREERTVETGLYRVRFTNQGATAVSWQLKKYRDDLGNPLELIGPGASRAKRYPLAIEFTDEKITEKVDRALFRMEVGAGSGGGSRVTFRYADGEGLSIVKVLELAGDSYVARLEVHAESGGQALAGRAIWGAGLGPHPGIVQSQEQPAQAVRAILLENGKIVRVTRQDLKDKPAVRREGGIAWAGLEDQYFAALFLQVKAAKGTTVRLHRLIEEGREKEFLSVGLDLDPGGNLDLFVGPKDYHQLASLKIGIERIVDFGFFGEIARALFFLLKGVNRVTGNWGWSIIILTLFIRVAFFPLTQKSSVSMRRTQEKMKRVQPKMQAIRERYRKMKKDLASRQKMNDEIMNLYKKEGINPLSGMSGCLPLLLQLPILWGFYNLLSVAIELRQAPFAFWIKDLSKPDPYYVTPIVMGITMLIQQAMTSSTIPDPTQRRIMMLMPILFTWFFRSFPSGLVIYWLVNNILAIGQQYLINAQAARQDAHERAVAKT